MSDDGSDVEDFRYGYWQCWWSVTYFCKDPDVDSDPRVCTFDERIRMRIREALKNIRTRIRNTGTFTSFFTKIKSHKEVTKQCKSRSFLLFFPDVRSRIRTWDYKIREAKKHTDPDSRHSLPVLVSCVVDCNLCRYVKVSCLFQLLN